MDGVLVVGVLVAMAAVLLQGGPGSGSAVLACRCEGGSDLQPDMENSLQWPNSGPRDAGTTSGTSGTSGTALDEVLTPALVHAYLALQLQRVAMDMAEKSRALGADCSSASGRCGVAPASRRRSKRFTSGATTGDSVPVFAGLAGLAGPSAMPSASALVDLRGGGGVRSKQTTRVDDESNDVPVFKGSNEGSPLARVVTPAPRPVASPRLAPGSAATSRTTTAPSVPVVKGSADPAHPTTPRVPDGLQLSPEEEKALAVLLAARPRAPTRPTARPLAPLPTPVTRLSGKVGGKAVPAVPAVPSAQTGRGQPSTRRKDECCGQRKLLQELERQLAILRQLNDDHLRADELSRAASYPSPYYPYLHNLPIHPSRGYEDAAPALLPTYFLSASEWRRGRPAALFPPSPPTSWGGGRGVAAVAPKTPAARLPATDDCDWSASDVGRDAADGGHLDDKVHFSEQQKALEEAEDLRGADPADDIGVDAKLSEPIDVEIR